MSWTCMQSFSFIPLTIDFWEVFWIFFRTLPFMLPWQPIKFSDLDKIHMNRRELLKKHFCKNNLNICSETVKIANFHFSHYKPMEIISCHSNQSSLEQKPQLFVPSIYRCYMWNMERIGFMASEEKSFKNVHHGRWMPAYTISSPMSLWLRWAKNRGPWATMLTWMYSYEGYIEPKYCKCCMQEKLTFDICHGN